jgi:superfamily II DNA or RNA helicase
MNMNINIKTMPKTLNTYLGQKGYTILKSELNVDQQHLIRTELTVKPHTPGITLKDTQTTFPAYRESGLKMYVPRHFGVELFGPPKECKIPEGEDISIQFMGGLRENQVPVVNAFFDHIAKSNNSGGGLLELPCAYGKCLGKNTEVLMFDGSIKLVQDIVVGDVLMGDDSTPRNVLTLARGSEMMYKVNEINSNPHIGLFNDGYIVNESHILSLKTSNNSVLDISVLDYLKRTNRNATEDNLSGYRVPITFANSVSDSALDPDPYLFGYWLGDNNHNHPNRTHVIACTRTLTEFLNKHDIFANKHIPHHYKCASTKIQKELFAGIIDSNNYHNSYKHYLCDSDSNKNDPDNNNDNDDNYYVAQQNDAFNKDVIFLARSLGFSCFKITQRGNEIIKICKKSSAYKIQVTQIGVDDYYGFEIDGNRRFVLGDFTVTHNTVLSLNICARLKKKTLIIVHKEFLMNQWIERIEQFIPSTRVGKIQGQIIDIENKDIVLCMLQSLSMKDYPAQLFDSFGLTIIDEVHHIGSEVFSRALFKLVTKYTLGLSATMNRKDGTTKIFKMFLGGVIYKGVRDKDDSVNVRAIEYVSMDDEFNTVEYDFRGNPAYSTMISKLCTYNHRTEFVLKVIQDTLIENAHQQIMVIAHNKNVLKYIHDAVMHRNIATVGYYVGGMKEAALKETESKQIVITTYSMASEALDIKTLTTLFMVTPKTEIEQTVGRILRAKSAHSNPLVFDIIDQHEPFQNQWKKRQTFYKKQGYKIIGCSSNKYASTPINNWDVIYNPRSSTGTGAKKTRNNVNNSLFDDDSDNDTCSSPVSRRKHVQKGDEMLQGKCLLKIK